MTASELADLERIEFTGDDPRDEALLVIEALARARIVQMRPKEDLGDLRTFYDGLIESLGEVVNIGEDFTQGGLSTGERWLEIRYDADIPDMAAFRHSKNAQPLHTDESYISDPADVMFFYCVAAASEGGETIFMSANRLIDRLAADDPALLNRLRSQPVTYAKSTNSRTRPIIAIDEDGLANLNFNFFCIDADQSREVLDLNKAFHQYLQSEIVDTDELISVGLQPGESVAWWDHLVLHGRTAFQAHNSGDRFIWKSGLRMDSSLRHQLTG